MHAPYPPRDYSGRCGSQYGHLHRLRDGTGDDEQHEPDHESFDLVQRPPSSGQIDAIVGGGA